MILSAPATVNHMSSAKRSIPPTPEGYDQVSIVQPIVLNSPTSSESFSAQFGGQEKATGWHEGWKLTGER